MPKSTRTLGLSPATILQAIDSGCRYGLEIMDATDLPSGAVYPALGRLERRGLVRGRWESEAVARREARPKRRYYEITPDGKRALTHAAERFAVLSRAVREPEGRRS